ncbi:MAG: hypothetical protein D8M59_11980 [Planctomycetes bacterium]|nr:hypothetical protein [Planctomycetota bacterium]
MTYGRDQACHLRSLSAASLKIQDDKHLHARQQHEQQQYADARDAQVAPSPVLARLRRDTDPHDLGKLVVRLATLAAQAHTMMMANEEQPQFDATRIAPLPFSGPADTTDQDDPGGGHAA